MSVRVMEVGRVDVGRLETDVDVVFLRKGGGERG
jgi:hypothetical protein